MTNERDIYATYIPDDEPSDLQPEMVLAGKYRLIKQIGSGAMGVVWQAHERVADRLVALKFVPKECSQFDNEMKRMRKSFSKIHALNHQSICPTYSLEEDGEFGYFLVMKYLEGETLDDYKHRKDPKRNGLPLDQVVELVKPIAQALDYAHRNDVIHRDIKPSNVFLSETAKGINVEIIDFGLADESGQQFEKAGTPAYMAPEQWQKQQQTATTDQYALAVIAYELLSGFPPFTRNIENNVLKHAPEPLTEIPEEANAALQKALAKKGEERFATCEDFIVALGGVKREPATVSPHAPPTPGTQSPSLSGIDPLMKRGLLALEDSEWSKASEFFDKVLNLDAEYAPAYVGLLCAELEICNEAELADHHEPLEDMPNYKKAVRFADDGYKATLQGYDEKIRERLRQESEHKRVEQERINRKLREKQERIEREQRQEEQRKREEEQHEQEQSRQRCEKRRQEIAKYRDCIAASGSHTIGLKSDGTVVANGKYADKISGWRDIVAVAAGHQHFVGLKSDGTVVTVGYMYDGTGANVGRNYLKPYDVRGWQDIVAVAADSSHTVGLKSDGTVVAVGIGSDLSGWRNIIAISASGFTIAGLKSDGTVVAVEGIDKQYNVSDWQDIVAVAANTCNSPFCLKSDGTVVTKSYDSYVVRDWHGIVAINCKPFNAIGLKSDGTVVAVGKSAGNVSGWRDIVAVAAGNYHTVGLKSDGTVVAVGKNDEGQCNTSHWRDIGPPDKEQLRRIQQGLCRHCGGQMAGFFTKKCKSCGRGKE